MKGKKRKIEKNSFFHYQPYLTFYLLCITLVGFLLLIYSSFADRDQINAKTLKTLESRMLTKPGNQELKNKYKDSLTEYLLKAYVSNNIESALEFCREAMFFFPKDKNLTNLVTLIYFKNAKRLVKQGKLNLAIKYLKNCQTISSSPDIFESTITEILIKKAKLFYENRNYSKAKHTLTEILSMDRKNCYALHMMGQILIEENNLQEALSYWQKIPLNEISNQGIDMTKKINSVKKDIILQKGFKKVSWKNFNFYSPREGEEVSYSLRSKINKVHRKIGKDFNYYPNYEIAIILYPQHSYNRISDAMNYPTAGLYDGKIRLPLGDSKYLYRILKHEYTHLVIRDLTLGSIPVWLNEGIAEYEAGVSSERKHQLKEKCLNEGIIPIASLDRIFLKSSNLSQISTAYTQSFAVIDYILTKFNMYTLLQMLEDFRDGYSQQKVFKKRLSKDINELTSEIEEFIRENY